MAIQLAKLWGAYVVTTCSAAKADFVKGLGADEALDYTQERFEQVYANDPFDVVLDLVGGDYEQRSMKVLKKTGHFAHVMNQGWQHRVGAYLDTPVELSYAAFGYIKGLVRKGPHYGLTFVQPSPTQMEAIGRLLQEGKLKAVIDKKYPLTRVSDAHEYLEQGHARGKVVLQIVQPR